MSDGYQETGLSGTIQDIHRAIISLQEELQAVDYYNQRAEVTQDAQLKALLEHNRDEEIEHASMLMEYLRRNMPEFDTELKTYLFKDLPITEIEAAEGETEDDVAEGGLGIGTLG